MSQPESSQDGSQKDEEYIFVAKMDNAKNLSNILKAVHFKEMATCSLSGNGLKVTVEDCKCVQANAFVQSGVFQEFSFSKDSATFKINLNVFMDCLNIFAGNTPGSPTALRMCYAGYGCPLILLLEEGGVLTDCRIRTFEPDDTLDFNFTSANVVNKIILHSECLREAFSELDMSNESLEVLMSPDAPYLRLSTFGYIGSSHADYPKDSDMVDCFECRQTQLNRYKVALIKPSTRALHISSKVSLRVDTRGFLSLQYMIKNEDGNVCFVEYLCGPDEELDDGNEDAEHTWTDQT
eukprot:scpid93855/ scgid2304/ Cell cycle checkpoint protein RAD1; DNA repair exonuclease rad1 homolog; Rad1-like DNA damage checkpoint protein &gt; Cell cycle checkpoint protein RAD1; DNA repair exonuclease rad1 homolog